jgi:hypothetical protein
VLFDGNHLCAIAVAVLITDITSETHDVGGKLGLLNFDNDVFASVVGFYSGAKIKAIYG